MSALNLSFCSGEGLQRLSLLFWTYMKRTFSTFSKCFSELSHLKWSFINRLKMERNLLILFEMKGRDEMVRRMERNLLILFEMKGRDEMVRRVFNHTQLKEFPTNIYVGSLKFFPRRMILFLDNDSQREKIDIVSETDELLPSSFENDDYDPGEIDVVEELLVDNPIPRSKNELSDFNQDDPLFPRPPPEPPDVEFDFEPNSEEVIAAVMNDNDELECFDPGGEIDVSTNVEDDDYFPFMFVIQIFLPCLTYPEVFPLLLSAEREDTIFDPENIIAARADNHPPILEKCQYNSWTSRIKLYLREKEHMKISTDKEKIRKECDIRATNIMIQGLPSDVYNLANHDTAAKEIWDRVKLLIEGTELSL
nr:hypothetical protein [Tanacetum cinerariifolium]